MKLVKRSELMDGYNWVCRVTERENKHYIKHSFRKGSWFDEIKLSISEILMITYLWVKKTTNEQIVDELNVSEPTVIDWKSFCREICVEILVNDSCEIDGPGQIIEIDESKFGKRKYNR